jgi:hypothetical protein
MSEAMHRVRRRAERVDVQHKREALAVVGPIRSRIGDWQLKLARINAHAARGNLPGELRRSLRGEIVSLGAAIREHRCELDRLADALPDGVCRNSWFTDTVRALQSVDAAVSRTASLLR